MIPGQPRKPISNDYNAAEILREFEAIHKRLNEFLKVGPIELDRIITPAGQTGAKTINKLSGTVNFAAGATTLVVTSSFVNKNSFIFGTIRTNDTTALIKNIVPGTGASEGTFLIRLNAAATGETSVAWLIVN